MTPKLALLRHSFNTCCQEYDSREKEDNFLKGPIQHSKVKIFLE